MLSLRDSASIAAPGDAIEGGLVSARASHVHTSALDAHSPLCIVILLSSALYLHYQCRFCLFFGGNWGTGRSVCSAEERRGRRCHSGSFLRSPTPWSLGCIAARAHAALRRRRAPAMAARPDQISDPPPHVRHPREPELTSRLSLGCVNALRSPRNSIAAMSAARAQGAGSPPFLLLNSITTPPTTTSGPAPAAANTPAHHATQTRSARNRLCSLFIKHPAGLRTSSLAFPAIPPSLGTHYASARRTSARHHAARGVQRRHRQHGYT